MNYAKWQRKRAKVEVMVGSGSIRGGAGREEMVMEKVEEDEQEEISVEKEGTMEEEMEEQSGGEGKEVCTIR